MRRVVLTWGAVLIALAAAPVAAHAQPSPAAIALTRALNLGMSSIGGASGAYVVDLTSGQVLYSDAAAVGRMPASVEKLYTTSTALLKLGPTATLTTSVWGVGSTSPTGAWTGTLYLKGGGDPTFGSAGFDRLAYGSAGATVQRLVADLVAATHITSIQGPIIGDGSYLDSLRGTPPTHFGGDLPDVEGLLGGLVFNRGFANLSGMIPQHRPALYAAQRFAVALRAARVAVPNSTPIYTGQVPTTATELAAVSSPPLAKLLELTNTPSDNYLAETLLKDLGAQFGGAGTTAAGFLGCAAAILNFDNIPKLPSIKVPTLVVCGSDDAGTPPAGNKRIAELIPGGRYEEIADARHFPNVEHPDVFNRIMMRWLDSRR